MNQIDSGESTGTIIAVFGDAKLIQKSSGRLELFGGTAADFIEARDWVSMFMPEVVIAKTRAIKNRLPV